MSTKLVTGDCVKAMQRVLEEGSVDAVVTDPPYGLEFMGKEWDRLATVEPSGDTLGWRAGHGGLGPASPTDSTPFGAAGQRVRYGAAGQPAYEWHLRWATAALRVAKPGAYLLAFGGTRTSHRLACAIEDAGWIIRDTLVWAYASGFPKSRALLKPAWEPIVMARKPGPLRGLDIDGCRITTEGESFSVPQSDPRKRGGVVGSDLGISGASVEDFQRAQRESVERTNTLGRWPANVVLTDPIFDGGWDGVVGGGETSSGSAGAKGHRRTASLHDTSAGWAMRHSEDAGELYGDTGTYSRFFLIPKASRSEREHGLDALPVGFAPTMGNGIGGREHDPTDTKAYRRNNHPTVKPIALMRHLVRLVTPTDGTVLDPFLGSGTTIIAAEMEGFSSVGIEREREYMAIARSRILGRREASGTIG